MQETLLDITRELITLRKKPSTQERFKQYPALMQQFADLVEQCDDVDTLRQIIELDSGYHLLAWYRQKTIEKWLSLERTPDVLRLYAMQLNLFGDVDAFGEADTDIDDRVLALEAEADALETENV